GDMTFDLDVCVVGGCGHVGLPLAITFAKHGLRVGIHDINEATIEVVRSGKMPFLEPGAEEELKRVIGKTLEVRNDLGMVRRAEHVVVVVGTPVDEHLNPTLHTMRRFVASLLPYLGDGQCLILRSTVYPGTTEQVHRMVQGLGRNVHV